MCSPGQPSVQILFRLFSYQSVRQQTQNVPELCSTLPVCPLTTESISKYKMTKIVEKKIRKSPILVSRFYKDWGKKKMIKMSLKKLKKIGDPESSLLCRAVLINNTLETVRSKKFHGDWRSPGPVTSLERSQYDEDEQRILNKVTLPSYLSDNKGSAWSGYSTVALPTPLSPLSDDEESDLEEYSNRPDLEEYNTRPIVNYNFSKTSEQQDPSNSLQSEQYLYEKNRRSLYNSYLSLCSADKFDCSSIMAA